MAVKEWIENLTQDIRQKNREAAEEFGRAQHQADIIASHGRIFFGDMLRCLEDNFTQIRKQLQGDPTSAEIGILTTGATAAHLTRSRFPWFDAHIALHEHTIAMEFAKELGIPVDPKLVERKTLIFDFHVDPEDKLSVQDAFGDMPKTYTTPEDLARKVTELLFEI